VFELISIVL